MNSFAMIRLVMAREINQRVKSKSFAITTVLLCAAILGGGILNRVLSGGDSPTKYDVAVVGDIPPGFDNAAQQTAQALDIVIRIESVADRSTAEQAVRDGADDAAIDTASGELVSSKAPSQELSAALNAAWQSAKSQEAATAAGLDKEQIATILSPAALQITELKGGGDDDNTVGTVVGFTAAILLFISINAFGGMVLTGVVEEKSTGVVEVLLAHVKAYQLLTGKVLGIGSVAMLQLCAAVATGVLSLKVSGTSVPSGVWVGLPTTLLWFVCGFVLYSTLFALAGSCVSRQEDAQGAAAPISMLFTVAYLTVFVLGNQPESTATRIVSILPPFAPLLMPLRVAVGAASVVEIVVAAALLIAATFGMLRLAGAVYGRTLLHRGSRLKWKDALRMKAS
ncbi:MAG: ABC transporter permease [Ilumatobacteraceae bacterium]